MAKRTAGSDIGVQAGGRRRADNACVRMWDGAGRVHVVVVVVPMCVRE